MNSVSHRIDTFLDALHESYTLQLQSPSAHNGGRRRRKRLKSHRKKQHQNHIYTITKSKQKQTHTKMNISEMEAKMYAYLSKHRTRYSQFSKMNL